MGHFLGGGAIPRDQRTEVFFVFTDVMVHLCMFHVNVMRENVTGQKEGSVTFG